MLQIISGIITVLKVVYELVKLFWPVAKYVLDKPHDERKHAPKEFANAVREGIGSPPELKNI